MSGPLAAEQGCCGAFNDDAALAVGEVEIVGGHCQRNPLAGAPPAVVPEEVPGEFEWRVSKGVAGRQVDVMELHLVEPHGRDEVGGNDWRVWLP